MPQVTVTLKCEFVAMGPPDPAELIMAVEPMQEGYFYSVSLLAKYGWDEISLTFSTSSEKAGKEQLAEFVKDLHCLHDGLKQKVWIGGEDYDTYLKIQMENETENTFKISGVQHAAVTDITPDPDEEDFFQGSWALAKGFQGLRISKPALARAIRELEAGIEILKTQGL